MSDALALLDQAIELQEGDVVVFAARDHLTNEQADSVKKALTSRLDPLSITFLVVSGLDVTVLRPQTNSTAGRAGSSTKETP